MKPTKIVDDVYDVGAIDWDIRNFHGYSTEKGSSYNAFLIIDEKVALVDTVKAKFSDDLINNISSIIDPKSIDIVISNHTEMDHSGGLPYLMHLIGEDKPLYCSNIGYKNLTKHFSNKWNYHKVNDGDTLNLGKKNLTFIEAKMLHWPDSMFTYINEDNLLFSSDGFGQHYASLDRFEDSLSNEVMFQAKKYFANILLPYRSKIIKVIDKIIDKKLKIEIICPDHGLLWRKNSDKIINKYIEWSSHKQKQSAVVIYDSMWDSTKSMGEAIAKGINHAGITVKPINISKSNRSDIITEILDTGAVIVGSPTLNNQMFPSVADVLIYMKGLKPGCKLASAFGSYGWSGEAVKHISSELKSIGFDLIDEGIKIQYVPNKKNLIECFKYGEKIGDLLKNRK